MYYEHNQFVSCCHSFASNVPIFALCRFTPDQARTAVDNYIAAGGGPTVSPWTSLYQVPMLRIYLNTTETIIINF